MPFKILVVGAGNMGALYDTPESDWILSHAHAICQHPDFELAGLVDLNPQCVANASARWKAPGFTSLGEAMQQTAAHGVVITTPDHTHEAVLTKALHYSPLFVVAEKPFTGDPNIAQRIADHYAAQGIPLVVNFTRRFIPEFRALREAIRNQAYGKLLAGQAYYGKGWRHNGSHLINTLQWVFDDVEVLGTFGTPIVDYTESDPSVNVWIRLENQVVLTAHAVDSRAVTVYELELLFEQQRIRVLTGGQILSHPLKENPVFSGYTNYDAPVMTQASVGQALPELYTHLSQLIQHPDTPMLSSPSSAIQTLRALVMSDAAPPLPSESYL